MSGQAEGYEQLPDGKFQPPMAMNCVELHLKQALADKMGRARSLVAHATLTGSARYVTQGSTASGIRLAFAR